MRNSFLFFFFLLFISHGKLFGQSPDTMASVNKNQISTDSVSDGNQRSAMERIIMRNTFLNAQGEIRPNNLIQRKYVSQNALFYILLSLIVLLAVLKTIYNRYFNNLLKVFFQTSLRQSQLTDQLMNAGLPSLLMNIFFIFTGALYITLLIGGHSRFNDLNWKLYGLMIIALTAIYTSKYLSLQFAGWISGYEKEAESYSFIVFLINKVMAIFILPLLVLIAFADEKIAEVTIRFSFFLVALIFFSRFFRSISVMQNRFRLNRFHFFLYITGVELTPILLICKLGYIFFAKNL